MFVLPCAVVTNHRVRTKKRDVVKTKVCLYFAQGACKKGERCDFLHGVEPASEAQTQSNQVAAGQSEIGEKVRHFMPWLTPNEGFSSKPIWASEESQSASTGIDEQEQLLSSAPSEDGTTSEASDEELRPFAKDNPMSLVMLEGGYAFTVEHMRF
jgi:hypothetical protein